MRAAHRLVRFLRRQGRDLGPLLILTHDHPDPDAVASAWALSHLARVLAGLETRIVHGGIIGRMENQTMVRVLRVPIRPLRRRADFARFKAIALVDTQPLFGNNAFPKERRAAIVVDHHPPTEGGSAACSVIEPQVGATSVLLAQALFAVRWPVPENLATALVYGILSETQDLGRMTGELEMKTYRQLLPLCDLRALALIQNPQRPKEFFQTVMRSLENAFVAGPLIGTHLGPVGTPDLVSQTADFLLTCEGMRWSVCTGRYRDRLHLSLRATRPGVHAGRLLQKVLKEEVRAGGHWSMAGGSIPIRHPDRPAEWRHAEGRFIRNLLRKIQGRSRSLSFPFKR